MQIDIELDEEQQDALDGVVAKHNASLGEEATPLTASEYVEFVIMRAIDGWTLEAYNKASDEIKEAYRTKNYTERKATLEALRARA
jgi:hypothetical protein